MKLNMSHKVLGLLVVALIVGFTYPYGANAAEKQDKSARRTAMMMQKMKQDAEQDKANMQAQFDLQKKELEDKIKDKDMRLQKAEKSLASAQHKIKKLEGEIVKANNEKAALTTKLQQTQATLETTQKNLAELKLQYSQAQADLKFNDNQRKTQSTNLAQTNKSLSICEDKNNKLHQFGSELISIYDKPSNYEAAMRKESFFQLKRVELENILQTYQDKLNDEHLVNRKASN